MRVARTTAEIRRQLKPLRESKTIAFVPTMGCLHEGHMQLVKKAKEEADIVVLSIYVNPLQFGPNEDLERYPRTFEEDAKLCEQAGVDFIFHPSSLYPKSGPKITLTVDKLCDCLCGEKRTGHFDGVVTVVNILFNIVQADIVLFGEKDWQQLAIIRRMASDLQMPIEIMGVQTVRETDGLAKSSRNRYLSATERKQAVHISAALIAIQQRALAGETDVETLKDEAKSMLMAAGITPEYLEIRNAKTLKPKRKLNKQPARLFIAARIGNTRLIDNMPLPLSADQTELRR